jgi:hypothetical protein
MDVQFTITAEDLVAFKQHCGHTSLLVRNSFRGCLVAVPLLIGILIILSRPDLLIWFVLAGIAWFLLVPLAWQRLVIGDVARVNANKIGPGILGQHTITISEQLLHEVTDVNNTKYAWGNIQGIEQTEQHVYIFTNMLCAHIIPKRAFATHEQAEAFYRAAQTYFHKARGRMYQA